MYEGARLRVLTFLLVPALALVRFCSATSGSLLGSVSQESSNIQSWLVDLRRTFHQHPELMYEEIETGKLIMTTLDDLGIKYRYTDKSAAL